MDLEETARAQPAKRASTCEWRQQNLGNLLSVGLPNGDLIEYLVDGMGRRVGKKKNGVLLKQWIYRDALKPVAELDGTGALVSEFVYGSKSNVPDYVRRGGATYRVISDHLGSPRYVVNAANSADVPFTATYTSFGEVTGTGLEWMPFGFAGGIQDEDTGFVRFGYRDLESNIGRWVAKDQLRFSSGEQNIYLYSSNDPVNRRDPSGLKDIAKCAATMFGCRLICPESYTPATFTACMLCLAKWAWDCRDMDLDDEQPVNNCPPGQHPGDWFESPCMPNRPEDPSRNSCDLRPDCDPSNTSCLPL